ncbi:MAG: prepilin peptidase [Gammaproteobacteria bacterium]|nr:prepilin peptidase [Gammaproteobacteria bacterium]
MTTVRAFFTVYPTAFLLLTALLGLITGSFLNVVIHRLPIMLERLWRRQCEELDRPPAAETPDGGPFNLVYPGSRCQHCQHAIRALENIPILSFLWLRGKCAACGKAISWRYPAVELLTGILSLAVAWRLGISPPALAALFLTWALIALAFIDNDRQILPDDITLPLLWAGLLLNVFGVFVPLSSAVIGAVAGYGSLWLVYQIFRLATGKEGMGFGDFKLFAALGAWLGWQQLPLIILLSSFLGAVVGIVFIAFFGRDRRLPIPFGPFLCVAGWIALMWGDYIMRAYLQMLRLDV